jgi:GDPmannose 4,6-dehydratase
VKALITGAAGQDGRLLGARLRNEGWNVLGISRKASPDETVEALDVRDSEALTTLMDRFRPDVVFHLAAHHHSSDKREDTAGYDSMVATNLLSVQTIAAHVVARLPRTRLIIAGSSKMFTPEVPGLVDETTPMSPSTMYGWTKCWARQLLSFYRERHGLSGGTAILFNHESTLRPPSFVTRKITQAAAKAKQGTLTKLRIENDQALTDWFAAEDAIEALFMMARADVSGDFVVASGTAHAVRDVLEIAFSHVGLDWRDHTEVTASRPMQSALIGNTVKLRSLGWEPRIGFQEMIRRMTEHDLRLEEAARLAQTERA